MKNMHMCCCIVDHKPGSVAPTYSLCCVAGVLEGMHAETQVTVCTPTTPPISTIMWRNKARTPLKAAWKNPENLQKCECVLLAITEEDTVDLTDARTMSPKNIDSVWIDNPLYILHESDRNRISGKSDCGWLDDIIISASQKLLAQQFPDIGGLQPPTLEQTRGGFTGHTGPFAQILNIRNSHWVLVSNLGCGKDVVHVYDTMYESLPSSTINTIAGLAFCPLSELNIKMVDVDL